MARRKSVSKKKTISQPKSEKKPRSGSSPRHSELGGWPARQKVFFKPERLRYVRRVVKDRGCVFCESLHKGVGSESLLLYVGANAMVILNKFPYNTGHLLVLPKRHCGDFLQLSASEYAEIGDCVRRAIAAMTEAYKPAGFNVGLNLGSAAGAGIPEHIHYHVIPRWNGDTNFFPLIADTKVVVETLEQTFERLIPYFPAP